MPLLQAFFLATILATASAAVAQMPQAEFIEVKGATSAVVLAHGRGHDPDGQVVAALRRSIANEVGLHTLSLQMPVLPTSDYLAYAATFPDAYKRLQASIHFLREEKGVKRIYLLGYSMGARMTTAFLATQAAPQVVGYIGIGVLEDGGEPLDANVNIRKLQVPVLDLFADATPLDLTSAEKRKALQGPRYRQIRITGANHSFKGHEPALSTAVHAWLREAEAQK